MQTRCTPAKALPFVFGATGLLALAGSLHC